MPCGETYAKCFLAHIFQRTPILNSTVVLKIAHYIMGDGMDDVMHFYSHFKVEQDVENAIEFPVYIIPSYSFD